VLEFPPFAVFVKNVIGPHKKEGHVTPNATKMGRK
jgi:hypothetical protein